MQPLTRSDLMTLEDYSSERARFRASVLDHKKRRQVKIGPNATLYFEDRTTIQYQVQEMLRIERIFEADGIEEELAAYNPLIPDGRNLKATFMLEYPEAEVRRRELARLVGVEDRVWVQVGEGARMYAIADEDLERSTEEKTSSVHFLRFELGEQEATALKAGAGLSMGIDHPAYDYAVTPLDDACRTALAADLD
jgi:hypothetical protein